MAQFRCNTLARRNVAANVCKSYNVNLKMKPVYAIALLIGFENSVLVSDFRTTVLICTSLLHCSCCGTNTAHWRGHLGRSASILALQNDCLLRLPTCCRVTKMYLEIFDSTGNWFFVVLSQSQNAVPALPTGPQNRLGRLSTGRCPPTNNWRVTGVSIASKLRLALFPESIVTSFCKSASCKSFQCCSSAAVIPFRFLLKHNLVRALTKVMLRKIIIGFIRVLCDKDLQ